MRIHSLAFNFPTPSGTTDPNQTHDKSFLKTGLRRSYKNTVYVTGRRPRTARRSFANHGNFRNPERLGPNLPFEFHASERHHKSTGTSLFGGFQDAARCEFAIQYLRNRCCIPLRARI